MNIHERSIFNIINQFGCIDIDYLYTTFGPWSELPGLLQGMCDKGHIKCLKSDYNHLRQAKPTMWYEAIQTKHETNIVEPEDTNVVNVLDYGFVKYIDHMGDDLRTVNAARISFNKHKDVFDDKDAELIDYLGEHAHHAPMRHNQVTLHIKAPIFVLRQWMKYKIASDFNEISSRYVNQENVDFHIPDTFRLQAKINKQGSEGAVDDQYTAALHYITAINACKESYKRMIESGVCREQARAVLPVSMYSEVYWTASLQTIAHFIHQRSDSHAQLEIQEYARAVRHIVEPLFPHSLASLLKNHT